MAKKTILSNPDSAEREYTRILLRYSRYLAANVNAVLIPKIGEIKRQFDEQARVDVRADGWLDTIDLAIATLIRLAGVGRAPQLKDLETIRDRINVHNDRQFQMVVKANTGKDVGGIGVNVFREEPFLQPLAQNWVKENTDLIKSLPTRLHPEIEGIVRRGVVNGSSVKQIQDEIKARYGVTESRARLIATDQTLKFNAQLTEYRLKSVGVKSYTWRTVNDSRVRPDHVDRNGKVFSWDKPPYDGNPGQPVRCRCHAEAIWDDVE